MKTKILISALVAQIIVGMGAKGGCGGVAVHGGNQNPQGQHGGSGGPSGKGGPDGSGKSGQKGGSNDQGGGAGGGAPVVNPPVGAPVVNPGVGAPVLNPGHGVVGVNAVGFDANGFDQLGLNTRAALNERSVRAAQLINQLRGFGFNWRDLVDWDPIVSFDVLVRDLNFGRGAASEKDIYNDLLRLKNHFARWQAAGYRITEPNEIVLVPNKIRQRAKFLDYVELWNSLNVHHDFYVQIFNALNHPDILRDAEFPDPADVALNADTVVNLLAKRDYLLIALASIKNPANNNVLDVGVVSATGAPYPTNANQDSWFAEMKYKLYHIAQMVDGLGGDDKRTLLSELLNAGKHCSDAKLDSITNAFKLFNPMAYQALEMVEFNLAENLQERLDMIASKRKSDVLISAINATHAIIAQDGILAWRRIYDTEALNDVLNQYKVDLVNAESATFRASTWDHYAERLGLKKRNAQYRDMRFVLTEDQLFGVTTYTPTTLLREVKNNVAVADEIEETYAGTLTPFLGGKRDDLFRGVLFDHGFLQNR